MARLPESQLGFSPTFNHRPACEEEEEEAPIVFSPLYQRNSNPKPQFVGALIEEMGLKGYQIGGAQVSELHANFILNIGSAKASDILRLIRHVQEQVFDRWSLWLEPEVKVLGEFDGI